MQVDTLQHFQDQDRFAQVFWARVRDRHPYLHVRDVRNFGPDLIMRVLRSPIVMKQLVGVQMDVVYEVDETRGTALYRLLENVRNGKQLLVEDEGCHFDLGHEEVSEIEPERFTITHAYRVAGSTYASFTGYVGTSANGEPMVSNVVFHEEVEQQTIIPAIVSLTEAQARRVS